MSLKISVIIPTWNRSETIIPAIQSVLTQTVNVNEILICDDGSTDSTEEIVNKLNNPIIKWLPGKHSGLPAVARNRGIRASQCEWIAFLDSDDRWHSNKLKEQVDELFRSKSIFVASNAVLIKNHVSDGNMLDQQSSDLSIQKLIKSNQIINSSVLVKKSVLFEAGLFPEQARLRAMEDYSLWLRIATNYNIKFINKSLVYYNDNPNESIRAGDFKRPFKKLLSVYLNYFLWLIQYRRNSIDVYPLLVKMILATLYLDSVTRFKNIVK